MDTPINQFPNLEYFLKMDYWPLRDAALLLLGIDPKKSTIGSYAKGAEKIVLLDDREISKYSRASGYGRNHNSATPTYTSYNNDYQKIIDLWNLTQHELEGEDRWISSEFSVSYILKWAERKEIKIIWLDWATKNSLLPIATKEVTPSPHIEITQRERNSLLNIIWALKDLYLETGNRNQARLIADLTENYGRLQGISESKLKAIFAEANGNNSQQEV